jgi:F-type H+-transporting ATPase subunit delta
VPVPRKKAVLATFAKELGLSTLVRNLLFVLIDHRRITQIGEIRVAFEDMVDEHLGFVRGEVQSAEPLDKSQLDALQTELDAISGKRVKMKTSVDPSLLGGVVARLGSTVYDGSIRGQLDDMRRKLSSESAQ